MARQVGRRGPGRRGSRRLRRRCAAGPIASPFVLEGAGTCRFTAEELYADQWLFHGPALQALVRVGPSSPRGIEGTLKVLPRRRCPPSDRHALRTDPIVIDAFTHLLGCWGLDQVPEGEGDVIFPLRVADLAILGADPREGAEVACRITIRDVSTHRVLADADFVRPDGRLWMRITGWEDWRFYWPSRYRDQFRQPDRVFVGEPLALPGAVSEVSSSVRAVWLAPPADMSRPVWRDVLEWVQLGPEERAACRAIPGPDARRTLRLWGRIAAKEAARRLWADRGGPPSSRPTWPSSPTRAAVPGSARCSRPIATICPPSRSRTRRESRSPWPRSTRPRASASTSSR